MSAEFQPFEQEAADNVMFEMAYATVVTRLREAIWLQRDINRYPHVWLEQFPGLPEQFAAFTLAADFRELIETGSEHFDVAVPVTNFALDERGILSDAEVAERETPYFVVSTRKYEPDHRYIISQDTADELIRSADAPLLRLDEKLLTFQIVPFRLREHSA